MNFNYITKYDYLKLGERTNVHTTIRHDIYESFQIECIKIKQPLTKSLDVILDMILSNEELLNEFKDKVVKYR